MLHALHALGAGVYLLTATGPPPPADRGHAGSSALQLQVWAQATALRRASAKAEGEGCREDDVDMDTCGGQEEGGGSAAAPPGGWLAQLQAAAVSMQVLLQMDGDGAWPGLDWPGLT